MRVRIGLLALVASVVAGLFAISAATAAPDLLVYSGVLEAENGLPYDGDVEVQASLFATMMDGTAVWTQDLGTVNVNGGVLEAVLGGMGGPGLATALNGNDDLWIEFTIDGEALLPRQRLASAPFALVAGNAQALGGFAADAFVQVTDDLPAPSLPADGLNEISNGNMSNEFNGVTYMWDEGPAAIPDFEAGPGVAQAVVMTTESPGSYLTSVAVQTDFTITANGDFSLILQPPDLASVPPVTLFSGALTPDVYTQEWTIGTTPELADLLGTQPAGIWTLAIIDESNNLLGTASSGSLNGFNIAYDVVRSDHVAVAGKIDVQGTVKIGGGMTCGAGDDGTLRWDAASNRLEVCAAGQWNIIWRPMVGSSPEHPGRTCAEVKVANPSAPNADYWIDVDGGDPSNAVQTFCNMASATPDYIAVTPAKFHHLDNFDVNTFAAPEDADNATTFEYNCDGCTAAAQFYEYPCPDEHWEAHYVAIRSHCNHNPHQNDEVFESGNYVGGDGVPGVRARQFSDGCGDPNEFTFVGVCRLANTTAPAPSNEEWHSRMKDVTWNN